NDSIQAAYAPGAQASGYSEVDAVRLAWYLLLEQDWSTERIAAHLTQLGIPTRTPGGDWVPSTVYQMFRNPIYKGERHYRKADGRTIVRPVTDAKGVSLALVSEHDWDRAQAVLAAHKAYPAPTSTREHLLHGLMRCALCGALYTVNWTRRHDNDGNPLPRHRYYVCGTRRMRSRWARFARPGGTPARDCLAATLDAERIEQQIWADIERFARHPEEPLVELAVSAQRETTTAETLRAELQDIQQELDARQVERDKAVALSTKGRIDERDLDRQLDRIQREERDITARRDALVALLQKASESAEAIERARLFLQRLHARLDGADGPLTPARKRETARALIVGIKVETVEIGVSVRGNIKRKARVDVTYRFQDPALDVTEQVCNPGMSTSQPSSGGRATRGR
ncbi:MAG TPA: recombinase family protein, partial [Ktedonobacterales bacterium]|nr:recombinase family protein [Ktedonobacterales bacterium]